jgi:hypothetical protein
MKLIRVVEGKRYNESHYLVKTSYRHEMEQQRSFNKAMTLVAFTLVCGFVLYLLVTYHR